MASPFSVPYLLSLVPVEREEVIATSVPEAIDSKSFFRDRSEARQKSLFSWPFLTFRLLEKTFASRPCRVALQKNASRHAQSLSNPVLGRSRIATCTPAIRAFDASKIDVRPLILACIHPASGERLTTKQNMPVTWHGSGSWTRRRRTHQVASSFQPRPRSDADGLLKERVEPSCKAVHYIVATDRYLPDHFVCIRLGQHCMQRMHATGQLPGKR